MDRSFILILGLAGFISAADNWIVSPVLPAIAAGFGVSVALAGSILTAYMVPYGLMQPVYGFLSDRLSKAKVLRWIVGGLALGSCACAFAKSVWSLLLCRAVTGFFAAGIISVSLALIGDSVPPPDRPASVGRFMGMVFLGQGLSVGFGGFLANFVSWRSAFLFFSVAALCALVLLRRLPAEKIGSDSRRFLPEVRRVVSTPKGKVIFPAALATGFLLIGLYSFLGSFLNQVTGLDYLRVGLVVMFYGFACAFAGSQVGGVVARLGHQRTILAGGCFALFAALLLVAFPSWQAGLLASIALGLSYIFIQSPLATIAFDVAPDAKGLPSALIGLGLFGGGGAGAAFCGWLLSSGGYAAIWLAMAAGITAFIIIVTLLGPSKLSA